MKNFFFPPAILLTASIIGCQNPCTKTTHEVTPWKDTIYTQRTYPNCNDTLNYSERKFKPDSTILSEGQIVNGQKHGDWTYNGYRNQVKTFKNGFEVAVRMYRKDGSLEQEEVLNADSLFEVRSYFRNGSLESEGFKGLDDYRTGRGIEYDTLGRKRATGMYISKPVLPDTVYIESPEPPYDLQMTTMTENGGKHGPWLYFDSDGNVTDTIVFELGEAVWTGNIVGKWKLDSISTTDTASIGPALFALTLAMSEIQGFEFLPNGDVKSFDNKGKQFDAGTYYWSRDRTFLYTTSNGENQRVRILALDENQLKLLADNMTFYLVQ